jgi:transposase-like protein
MATVEQHNKLTRKERHNRYFSEDFKKKKVSEIERNLTSVAEVCREYQVSGTSVYRWIYTYSHMRKKGIKQVVEAKSDTRKIKLLEEKIKELERVVGQKQIKIDVLEKMVEIAEESYGIDIKKNASTQASNGSGSTGKNTNTR